MHQGGGGQAAAGAAPRWDRRQVSPWLPAWLVFGYLAIAVSPAHFWLDSGEIAAAGAELGVIHPTGVPGYAALLHLASALPLGSLGMRMALVSAACMAGACALLVAILNRRRLHWALSSILVLWLPLGLTIARNGRVVEIYGFAALLLAATLWGFDPAVARDEQCSRRCVGVMAAVVATWGFGDLRLALVPPVVLAWLLAWRRAEPWVRWAPLAVALASAVVLTLPLASSRAPVSDWGNPESWPAIWDHVQARTIREAFAVKLAGMSWRAWSLELRLVVERLGEDLGPLGLLLAVAALALGLSRPLSLAARERGEGRARARASDHVDDDHRLLRWVAWIVAVELVYCVAINPMGGRDRQTGVALCLLAALVVALELGRRLGERKVAHAIALPLLAAVLWIPSALVSVADARATRSWAPHEWTREVLAQTPGDALVLSQSDDLSAGLVAARVLEGARPDLVAIPAQHLYRSPSEAQRARPREAALWQAIADSEAQSDAAQSDADRVVTALAHWRGHAVLESPSAGVLAGVALPGTGEPPIWITRLPLGPDALPVGVRSGLGEGPSDPLAAAIERWRGRLDARADRERLADALALWIHGTFARAPDSPLRWLEAERGYRLILDELLPDHPRSLVGLAATRDRFGETHEAIALTRRALELDPERPTALANLALYLSRDPATLDEARELAELAAELAADKRSVWSRLAMVCSAQGDEACVARAQARL